MTSRTLLKGAALVAVQWGLMAWSPLVSLMYSAVVIGVLMGFIFWHARKLIRS